MRHDLFLLSTSRLHGQPYLAFAIDAFLAFMDGRRSILVVPFAGEDHDLYTRFVRDALAPTGIAVTGIHAHADPVASINEAEVILVGGGNTFRLARGLQRLGLLDPIRRRVSEGTLGYMGSSAGSNMACPSIRTTNDMPIIQPPSLEAIGLIPFQINPHYQDADPNSTFQGETRAERIAEFLGENDVAVLGMREGSWLRRQDDTLTLEGEPGAVLFLRESDPVEIEGGNDLSTC